MRAELFLLVASALLDIFICALVIYRNYRNPANVLFGLTSAGVVLWAICNFLCTALPASDTLFFTRLTGMLAAVTFFGFVALSTFFPNRLKIKARPFAAGVVLTLVVSLLCFSSFFIRTAIKNSSGLTLEEGVLYPLYFLYVVGAFILCNVNFILQFRRARKLARSQLKFMWLGMAITVFLAVSSNVFIPAITRNWSSSKYGTVFIIPFVALTAYAILRRRMFDLRLIISRAVAYFLLIGVVATLYSLLVMLVATRLVHFGTLDASELVALVVPAIFIAFTFHQIQIFIERITKLIFYRNVYDLRDILDRLSDLLLAESDIDSMMRRSLELLTDAIKPTTGYLAVLNESGLVYKHIAFPSDAFGDLSSLMGYLHAEPEALIEASEAPNRALEKVLNQHNAEIFLRLGSRQSPSGFLLLGPKHNGGLYTDQDSSLLGISAKSLGVALENAKKYEQILRFSETLHDEVNSATARLRKANLKLKTLDGLKDDFISIASHQLSSPAVSVHDALTMLDYPNITAKDRQEMLAMAESNSERLVTVVRTMLNMARIQSGHFVLDASDSDLNKQVEAVLKRVKVTAEQRHIELIAHLPDSPVLAHVDVPKINEAMANYVDNAIKYSESNTTIDISLIKHENTISFEVADRGIGVPEKESAKLFQRFYRTSNARLQQPDGNGIGLYVVKMIAEAHGGEAYYKARELGGSVFGFWIKRNHHS